MNLSFLLALLFCVGIAQSSSTVYQAKLETQRVGDLLTISGHCLNATEQTATLRYELFLDKQGQAGTSRNTQGGEFTVASRQDKVLSQTTINVAPTDTYRIRLQVFNRQGEVVAADSLIHTSTAQR